jgi:DNA adenine methylase
MCKMKEQIILEVSEREEQLKPFIRWAGGKQNLIQEILANLDLNGVKRFFEPFLGGASFFLHSNFEFSFLSDLNSNLTNCYQQIKLDPKGVFEGLSKYKIPVDPNIYYEEREAFNENSGKQTLKQAVRFIFLNRTSYNGIYRVNKLGAYNVPFGKSNPAFSSLRHLQRISSKLQRATIFAGFYDEIEDLVGIGDLIYLDPPYPKLSDTAYFNHYTLDKFDNNEQKKVAKFAGRLKEKGCKVVISNADLLEIRDLYTDWDISECTTFRYISCKKDRIKVKELIIKNF